MEQYTLGILSTIRYGILEMSPAQCLHGVFVMMMTAVQTKETLGRGVGVGKRG